MPYQIALTIASPIRSSEVPSLLGVLEHMAADPTANEVIPFGRFNQVHFARLLLLDESTDPAGRSIPPYLLFISDIDDPLDGFLEQLLDVAGPGVDQIWSHCPGYPPAAERTRASRLGYLRARMISADAVYINTVGRSAQQVVQESALRGRVEDYLDRSWSDLSSLRAQEVRAAIQRFVGQDRSLNWALEPAEQPAAEWQLKEKLHMVGVAAALVFLLPFGLFIFPFWALLLRLHETADKPLDAKPSPAHAQALAALEDHMVQNQFSAIGYFKPGWFRRITAQAVLWLVNNAVRHIFNHGELTGVKTIHFARWIPLNNRRRLLFASNYDGSLESYMDDFIDKVAWGLNAVFSNGIGYPRTNWLILDGARNELAFKHFLRIRQFPTQVWYTAYGQLTAVNVANNARLREGLSGDMSETETQQWLARF